MRRGAALAAAGLLAAGCGDALAPGPDLDVFRGEAMGTRWEVRVVSPGFTPERRVLIQARIQAALDRVDGLMSHYRPDSELSRFNRSPGLEPFPLSPETLAVLEVAEQVSRLSDGALDVSVAPLVDAWGFGAAPPPEHPPDAAAIARLRERVGWQLLRLDSRAGSLSRLRPGVEINLSSVAKGYAVDLAAEALAAEGLANVMVELGGELRTAGRNPLGEPWRIGIELPAQGLRALHGFVPLSGLSLASSGEYRNYRVVDGVRVSHTIDPRTGEPIRHALASVSVVDASCARADALATALNVLGPEAGWELALSQELAALFLVADAEGGFDERRTPAFARLGSPGRLE